MSFDERYDNSFSPAGTPSITTNGELFPKVLFPLKSISRLAAPTSPPLSDIFNPGILPCKALVIFEGDEVFSTSEPPISAIDPVISPLCLF